MPSELERWKAKAENRAKTIRRLKRSDHRQAKNHDGAILDLFLAAVAASPFCHCGEEPYTDGTSCPTCLAIMVREQRRAAWLKRRKSSTNSEVEESK